VIYGVRKSINYDDLRRINFKVICRLQSYSNGMFCSCSISTDKRVVRSLCNSRASCITSIHLSTSTANVVAINPVHAGIFGTKCRFLPFCPKRCSFALIISGVTGPILIKFAQFVEIILPLNLFESKLR